jgi:7-cyano-7-deazaguanine synthase
MANLATKAGVEGDGFTIHAPLLHMSKVEIINQGMQLGVDYSMTQSCYDPDNEGHSCGQCDACRLRDAAFAEIIK